MMLRLESPTWLPHPDPKTYQHPQCADPTALLGTTSGGRHCKGWRGCEGWAGASLLVAQPCSLVKCEPVPWSLPIFSASWKGHTPVHIFHPSPQEVYLIADQFLKSLPDLQPHPSLSQAIWMPRPSDLAPVWGLVQAVPKKKVWKEDQAHPPRATTSVSSSACLGPTAHADLFFYIGV